MSCNHPAETSRSRSCGSTAAPADLARTATACVCRHRLPMPPSLCLASSAAACTSTTTRGTRSPSAAAELARQRLGGMGNRWRHTQAVAARARSAGAAVEPHDRELLVAAGWLHDIGYADPVAYTGLHPLDGAEYLTRLGFARRLVALVAHHSCARFEAAERGLTEPLETYVRETGPVADALIYADMTIG